MLRKQKIIIISTLLSLISCTSFAMQYLPAPNPDVSSSNFDAFPYDPRASVWGYEGTRGLGEADVMVPLVGNSDNILYVDPEGKYASNDTYSSGIGLGFRHVIEQSHIIGAYVFGDYSNAIYNQHFWDINPGVEWMGNLWDFRTNGYIPIGNRSSNAGDFFGDQIGIYQFVSFQGHTQYDHIFNVSDQIGPGLDAEVGRVIPGVNKVRAYVGGYYFSPSDADNIQGIEGRVEYRVNHYVALEATDTYDNLQHNAALLGIRLTAGGVKDNEASYPLQSRLLDPIPRNIATTYAGNALPVERSIKDVTPIIINRSHVTPVENTGIYFFNASSGSVFDPTQGANNCTFADPCIGTSFTNTTLNDINTFTPNASMYLSTGSYSPNSSLSLSNGQSVFGRTADFSQPATGSNRPVISGNFTLNGNNTLDSLQLIKFGTEQIGVFAIGASNITISNDLIGGNSVSQGYSSAAVELLNPTKFTISNSVLNGFDNTGHGTTTLLISNGAQGNLNQDSINYTETSTSPVVAGAAFISGTSSTSINSTNINITSTAPNVQIVGLSDNASSLTLDNDMITADVTTSAPSSIEAIVTGMQILSSTGTTTINDSTITAKFNGGTTPYNLLLVNLTGLSVNSGATAALNSSSISTSATAIGISSANLTMTVTGIQAPGATITGDLNTIAASGTETGATTPTVTSVGVNTTGGTNSLTNTTYNVTVSCSPSSVNCTAANTVP